MADPVGLTLTFARFSFLTICFVGFNVVLPPVITNWERSAPSAVEEVETVRAAKSIASAIMLNASFQTLTAVNFPSPFPS